MDAKLAALASAPDGEQELRLGAAALKAGSLVASGWISRSYCEQALVSTLMGCRAYDPRRPLDLQRRHLQGRPRHREAASPAPSRTRPGWPRSRRASGHPRSPPHGYPRRQGQRQRLAPRRTTTAEAAEGPAERLKLAAHVWKHASRHPDPQVALRQPLHPPLPLSHHRPHRAPASRYWRSPRPARWPAARTLLGVLPAPAACKVGYWNGEDPLEETERRVMAICKHHDLTPEPTSPATSSWAPGGDDRRSSWPASRPGARSWVDDGDGRRHHHTVRRLGLDVLIIDPLRAPATGCPRATTWRSTLSPRPGVGSPIAPTSASSIIHHPRKTNGAEVTVEDSRGAIALVAAARSARVLNQMSEDEARNAGIAVGKRRAYFRSDIGVPNLAAGPRPLDVAPFHQPSTWRTAAARGRPRRQRRRHRPLDVAERAGRASRPRTC